MRVTSPYADPHLHSLSDLVGQIISSMCTTTHPTTESDAHHV